MTGASGTPRARFDRARVGVMLAYVFNGFALASWTVRLPTVRDDLSLTAGDLAVFLTSGAVGTLVMATFAGILVSRVGARAAYLAATAVFVVAYALLAGAVLLGSFPLLLVGGIVQGVAFATTNVPQSLLAAASERRVGRTILPQFHAGYSIGAAAGAAAGGALAAAAVGVSMQFMVLIALAVAVRTVAHRIVRGLLDGPVPAPSTVAAIDADPVQRTRHPLAVWADPQLWLVAVLVFAAGFSEGTANNWVPVAVVDAFAVADSDGALLVSVFLIAQTILRMGGGHLVDRFGRLSVLVVSGVVTIAGVAVFVFAPALPVAAVGAALWGAGAALGVPICISVAASDPREGTARVAAVTSVSSIAMISGPPIIGALGGLVGVRGAMIAVAVCVAVSLLGARRALRPVQG